MERHYAVIEIAFKSRRSRRPLYRVVHEGRVLVENSQGPEHQACRTLRSRGLTGELVLFGGRGLKRRTIVLSIATGAPVRIGSQSAA